MIYVCLYLYVYRYINVCIYVKIVHTSIFICKDSACICMYYVCMYGTTRLSIPRH